jgi:arginase family enzyme
MEIVQVPFINSTHEKGCELAPSVILKEFKKLQYNEKGKSINHDQLKISEIKVNLKNSEESFFNILNDSREIIERNFKSIFIGGDHSISYPIAKSFFKTEENPLLIVFDANANCKLVEKNPKNDSWIRELLENEYYSHNILLVSTRNYSLEEINYLKKKKIVVISMDVLQEDLSGVTDMIMERSRNSSGFYISIDINSIDPAFAPGTNCIEPGGLSSRELIYILKRLSLLENFKVADITEINLKKDFNDLSVKLGAKLISELV